MSCTWCGAGDGPDDGHYCGKACAALHRLNGWRPNEERRAIMNTSTNETEWTDDMAEVRAFARILDTAGAFDAVSDALYYFDKPHKWTAEWKRWVAAGRPVETAAVVAVLAATEA